MHGEALQGVQQRGRQVVLAATLAPADQCPRLEHPSICMGRLSLSMLASLHLARLLWNIYRPLRYTGHIYCQSLQRAGSEIDGLTSKGAGKCVSSLKS